MNKRRDYISLTVIAHRLTVSIILILTTLNTISCTSNQSSPGHSIKEPHDTESSLKIVIYTDFECGACGKFNLEIEPYLREFEAAGNAQIEIRLVGALSEESLYAAEVALCATNQGKFLEYHDALFQATRQNEDVVYSQEKLMDLAGSLGLDVQALRRCLDSDIKKPELEKNMDMAGVDSIRILPTVFINGIKIEGFKSLDTYINVIDGVLAQGKIDTGEN